MNNEYSVAIKKQVEDFFEKTTFEINDVLVVLRNEIFFVNINTEHSKTLIGERGKTLAEIQHIIRGIVRRQVKEDLFVEVDINNYKQIKNEKLRDVAKDIADEVSFYKTEKILPVMNPYERRIIHLALEKRSDIETESIGEGLDRRVVVRPAQSL